LHAAAWGCKEDALRFLIGSGVDTNILGGRYGTALQAAAHAGCKSLVLLLLERGAKVNTRSGLYGNALQAAVLAVRRYKSVDGSASDVKSIVQMLLDQGANVDAEGGMYESALQAAAYEGNEDIVQLLLDHGALGEPRMRRFRHCQGFYVSANDTNETLATTGAESIPDIPLNDRALEEAKAKSHITHDERYCKDVPEDQRIVIENLSEVEMSNYQAIYEAKEREIKEAVVISMETVPSGHDEVQL
jgi:ankyrin repeat protein